jgi:hypothetical protein
MYSSATQRASGLISPDELQHELAILMERMTPFGFPTFSRCDKLLTRTELQAMLGLDDQQVNRLLDAGILPQPRTAQTGIRRMQKFWWQSEVKQSIEKFTDQANKNT